MPPSVRARIWIDEERSLLKAVARNPEGELRGLGCPLDTKTSVSEQIRAFSTYTLETQMKSPFAIRFGDIMEQGEMRPEMILQNAHDGTRTY